MVSGAELRAARQRRRWTQVRAAVRLGVSQAYLSLVETGRRPVSRRLFARLRREYALRPTAWPFLDFETCDARCLAEALASLGYPGFGYLRPRRRLNPAQVLLIAVKQDRLESRAAAALPWVVAAYPDLNWNWLVDRAKVADCQNRLGFVVSLARQLAVRRHDDDAARGLSDVVQRLELSRLAREDSLGQADMTDTERRWLRLYRSDEARRWNLLTDLSVEHLRYAT